MNEFLEMLKAEEERRAMKLDAMSGISRAKPGSVRRLVEALKCASHYGLTTVNADAWRYLQDAIAALAEIELEQENAK